VHVSIVLGRLVGAPVTYPFQQRCHIVHACFCQQLLEHDKRSCPASASKAEKVAVVERNVWAVRISRDEEKALNAREGARRLSEPPRSKEPDGLEA
jgi:hypothetical protein